MVEPMTDYELRMRLNEQLEAIEAQTDVLRGVIQILHGLHHDDSAMDIYDCIEVIMGRVSAIDELFGLNE